MRRRTKIWLGVGVSVLAGAGVEVDPGTGPHLAIPGLGLDQAAAQAGHAGHRQPGLQVAQTTQGGEGGGGEGGEVVSPASDVGLLTNLVLIRGHLHVGHELVEAGDWDDAVVHFLHPAEEIYAGIEGALAERGIESFDAELAALAALVQAKTGGAEYESARAAVLESLDAAEAKIETGSEPATQIAAAEQALAVAGEEYQAAVKDGKIVNIVEYQDSRGFVLVAEEMVGGQSEQARAAFQELKRAWPSARPPAEPVMLPGEVLAAISNVELVVSARN